GGSMKAWRLALAVLPFATLALAAPSTSYRGVARADLIAAAKAAPLRLIDNGEDRCDGATPIGVWLRRLTASQARAEVWTAGKCELVTSLNPLDAGGDYCAQARIRLKRPQSRADVPEIEIFLESPQHGRPGAASVFRDVFVPEGAVDYERDGRTFEAQGRDRFKDAAPAPCEDK